MSIYHPASSTIHTEPEGHMRAKIFHGRPGRPMIYRPIHERLLQALDRLPRRPSLRARRLHSPADIAHVADLLRELEALFDWKLAEPVSYMTLTYLLGELVSNAAQHGAFQQPLEVRALRLSQADGRLCLVAVRNIVPPGFNFDHFAAEPVCDLEHHREARGRGLACLRDNGQGFIARPYSDRSIEFVLSYCLVRRTQP